jgi:PAS domain S-box-containing protein
MTVRHDVAHMREVEEALRRSEAKYRGIFENIQDIFFQTNDQGLIVEVSPSVERYGYTREELIGMPATRVYEDPSKRITLLQLLEDGDITDREVRLRTRDGRVVDFSISAHMLRGPDGSPAGMEGCLRDISDRKLVEEELRMHRDRLEELVGERTAELTRTNERLLREAEERRRAEEALRTSEERFSKAFHASPLAIVIATVSEARIVDVNEGFLQLTGYSREEAVGRTVLELGIWVDSKERERLVQEVLKRGSVLNWELKVCTKSGETWDLLTAFVVIELDGEPCLMGMSRDVTERKRAEEALRESEERFRQVLEVSSDLICKVDIASNTSDYVSPAVLPLTGFTQEEFAALGIRAFLHRIHPDDRPQYRQRIDDFLRRGLDVGAARRHEYRWQCKDGQYRWFSDGLALVRGEDGQPLTLVVNARDTTERKRAEQEMRIRDSAIASSIDAIAMGGLDGNVTYVNRSCLSLWGYDDESEMLGKPMVAFWQAGAWVSEVVEALLKCGSWVGELVGERKDGSFFDAQASLNLVRDEAGKAICAMGSFVDITERRQAGEALRESERRFRQVLDVSSDMIYKLDLESDTFDYISPSVLELTGFTREEFIAMGPRGLRRRIHPEDWPDFKRGSEEFVELGSHPGFEYRLQCKDGEYRWLSDNRSLVRGESGRPLALVGTVRDVTQRRQGEEQARQLHAEHVRANELRRMVRILEQMAATLGHELRNPLGVISNSVYFLANQAQIDGPKAKKHVLIIGREVAGAKRVIDDILEFAHVPQLLPAAASVNAVVDSALARSQIPANVRVVRRLAVDLPPLVCDEERLERAFIDMIANAVQAMPHGGRLGVNTCRSGDRIQIVFADSGEGIAPENLDKVFEPMFTTKLRGIGLGLTVVRRTVEQHGGSISVRSRLGRGTVFAVALPRDCRPFDAEGGRVA